MMESEILMALLYAYIPSNTKKPDLETPESLFFVILLITLYNWVTPGLDFVFLEIGNEFSYQPILNDLVDDKSWLNLPRTSLMRKSFEKLVVFNALLVSCVIGNIESISLSYLFVFEVQTVHIL